MARPRVTAVVVAYGDEPWLERSVDRIRVSEGVDVEVVLVDNGCTDGAVDRLDRTDRVTAVRPGTAASGGEMEGRGDVCDQLCGLCDEYFGYVRDEELSLRAWAAGHRVVYVPTAVVVHRYEFSRNEHKSFLVDRNRMIMTATC